MSNVSNVSVINLGQVVGLLETNSWTTEDDMRKVKHMLKHKQANIEFCWDVITAALDSSVILSATNFIDQSLDDENNTIAKYQIITENKDTLPAKLEVGELLGIVDDVGLKCPECKHHDVEYKMIATRSADEGMTADCVCRRESCKNRFRIRV
jgi:DNA-directed RNA polymerase subunit M/transcription elongation factor TFIIS